MKGSSLNKKWKKEVTNQGEEVVAIVAATNDAKNLFDPSNDEGEFYNFVLKSWIRLVYCSLEY